MVQVRDLLESPHPGRRRRRSPGRHISDESDDEAGLFLIEIKKNCGETQYFHQPR
jgi:hypothetical protein